LGLKLESKSRNVGWYETRPSETVVIFIHGVFSNSEKCWTASGDIFWPELLANDPRIKCPRIFLAEFYTSYSSGDYGIEECAKEVYGQLNRVDSNLNESPLSFPKIVFVAHSTGGIVARYILDQYRESFVGKDVGLCLYASPSYGSKLANLLGIIGRFAGHKLARELKWGSDILVNLESRFVQLVHSDRMKLVGLEAIENNAPLSIPILRTRVVESTSAARYFGNRKIVPNTDHSSIVKPVDHSSVSHQLLIDFLLNEKLLTTNSNLKQIKYPSLFDRYQTKFEDFYLSRDADGELSSLFNQYSLWVSGPPGFGKTVALTRVIELGDHYVRYISLAACVGSPARYLMLVINSELSKIAVDDSLPINDCLRNTAEIISAECKRMPFCLFIEEIPIADEEEFSTFVELIFALLNILNSCDNFKLILSSIFHPDRVPPELEKNYERMQILKWLPWDDEDFEKLADILTLDTGIELDAELLSGELENNPRQLKQLFRDKLRNRSERKSPL